MFDKENRGTVSFDDFGALWQYVTDWQNCFRGFDRDGSGSIDRAELQSALITFNYNLSNECIDTILRKFDRRGDGKIFFDDFIQCCVVLQVRICLFSVFLVSPYNTNKLMNYAKLSQIWFGSFK